MGLLPTVDEVARPAAAGYGAALDGILVRLAATPDSRIDVAAAPNVAGAVNTADSPEEVLTQFPAFSIKDVSGGEGLYFAHGFDRQGASNRDARRFWRSRGIDPMPRLPGEPQGFTLLHDVFTIRADVATNQHGCHLDSEQAVFVASGSSVVKIADPLGAASTSTEDPHSGTAAVTGLAAVGGEVFAACGADGIGKRAVGGTWSDLASAPTGVVGLWSAKGRPLAATTDGTVLVEVSVVDGTPTTLLTIPTGDSITTVVDAGSAVLVAATNGIVYALAPDSTGVLQPVGESRLPVGEHVTSMAAAFGQVVLGVAEPTTAGGAFGKLYTAELSVESDGSYGLRNLFLHRVLDTTNPAGCRRPYQAVTTQDGIVVATCNDTETIFYRYMLATGGWHEHLVTSSAGFVDYLDVIDDRIIWTNRGVGLSGEDDQYVTSGYLISSAADFFTAVSKAWMQVKTQAVDLSGGATVSVDMSTDVNAMLDPDSALWTPISTLYADSQVGELVNIVSQEGRYASFKITLTPAAARTSAPTVGNVTAYAYPQAETVTVRLPVNVSDRVERRNRRAITVAGLGATLLAELIAMRGRPVLATVYRPSMAIRGVVTAVEASTPGLGGRGSGALVAFVTIEGTLTGGTSSAATESALGVSTLGVATMGV